jgi:glycosyltransferase involved in cell wall biosynthesis
MSDLRTGRARRVLVVSSDLLPLEGMPTTGAGLRAWSLGQGLAGRGHTIVYAMPRAALAARKLDMQALPVLLWDQGRLDDVIREAGPDVVVACGWSTLAYHLNHSPVPVVLDQHGPHLLERQFQKHLDDNANAAEKLAGLAKADFFTCAGARQYAYFRPWLQRAGFVDPATDSAVIPVSLGGDWPLPEPAPVDPVTFVYGGVFLPWQDPSLALTTLVERMDVLDRGRLRIFGGKHPFIPIDTSAFDRLAGLLAQSRHVEISPMLDRATLLAEYARAHVAIDLMRRNPERELAFTTRTVEYLWCGLPVIYNHYAELADYIGPADAGWCLDPEDQKGMAEVFDQILLHPAELPERSRHARSLAEERLNWASTIGPLDHFCRTPHLRPRPASAPPIVIPHCGLLRLFDEAARHYRRGGPRTLADETWQFIQRQVGRAR